MDVSTLIELERGDQVGLAASNQAFIAGTQDTQAQSAEETEIDRLRSTSDDYKHYEKRWRFFLRAYEGGPEYVSDDTLFRHSRETVEDFQARLERAHYQNYCQSLVDFVPEYIFSQDVEREPPDAIKEQFERFKSDVDRAGTELNAFMQMVGEDMRIFGMTYIHVDLPPRPEEMKGQELSVQQAKDYGLDLPYFVLVRPLEVLDWKIDNKGNFLYLKRVEYTIVEISGQKGSDAFKNVERYTEWTPHEYRIAYIDVSGDKPTIMPSMAETRPNSWGMVPFVPCFYKRLKSHREVGQSFLQDIAYQNRAVFNQTSLIDEFLYKQAFNILAVPTSHKASFKDQTDGHIGTSNVIELPSDATMKPEYISPPSDPAKFIQMERENTVREMYRQAAQDVMSDVMTPGRHSGESLKVQMSRTVPVINKSADALQYAERRAMRLWAKIQGFEWTGKISYKDDYSVTNLMDLLLQLTMIFKQIGLWSPTFIKEEWKRVVREFDGKLKPDTMDAIVQEIESLSDEDLQRAVRTSSDSTPGLDGVPTTANMIQGAQQEMLGTDQKIAAAFGSQAATKERLADGDIRSTRPSQS